MCECECVHCRLSPRLGWNSCLWLEGKLSRSKLDFMLSPSQQQYATLRQTHLPSAFTTKLALWFFKGWSFKHSCMTFFFFSRIGFNVSSAKVWQLPTQHFSYKTENVSRESQTHQWCHLRPNVGSALSRIPLYFNLRVKAKPKCSEPSGFLVIRHPSTTRLPLSLLQWQQEGFCQEAGWLIHHRRSFQNYLCTAGHFDADVTRLASCAGPLERGANGPG